MGQEQMTQLADRLMSDPAFREEFNSDPEGTIKAAGLKLSDSDLEALRSTEWQDLSDAELKERVSKMMLF
jgi:hypothetical protein